MNRSASITQLLIIFGTPLILIGFVVLIAGSPYFSMDPEKLSIGITLDLLLTVPLVYYLLIRRTKIPKSTVIPFFIAGILVCSSVLPPQDQHLLNIFKTWMIPVVELSILTLVVLKLRKGIRIYRSVNINAFDFFTCLKSTCQEILPKQLVMPFVTEIAVFYYGFINWKKRKLNENEFTYHINNGTTTLLIAIIIIITIESFAFHILLMKWSSTAAWILTCLSVYSGIQLFGFLRSMSKRPISIEDNILFLRYGIMNETTIDISKIDSIEISSKDIEFNNETRNLSFLGKLESHNIVIRLKEENTLTGLYGIKRKYRTLALYVDDKTEFKNRIDQIIQQI